MDEGFAIWITGLPASGKSTIAKALTKKLAEQGVKVQILESDELRRVLTPKPPIRRRNGTISIVRLPT